MYKINFLWLASCNEFQLNAGPEMVKLTGLWNTFKQ